MSRALTTASYFLAYHQVGCLSEVKAGEAGSQLIENEPEMVALR